MSVIDNFIVVLIQLQELEMENSKLKEEMNRMRKIVIENAEFDGHGKGSPAAKEFMRKYLCSFGLTRIL